MNKIKKITVLLLCIALQVTGFSSAMVFQKSSLEISSVSKAAVSQRTIANDFFSVAMVVKGADAAVQDDDDDESSGGGVGGGCGIGSRCKCKNPSAYNNCLSLAAIAASLGLFGCLAAGPLYPACAALVLAAQAITSVNCHDTYCH